MAWHFKGAPHYIDSQITRMGGTPALSKQVWGDPRIYKAQTLMAQLNERYKKAPKDECGRPVFDYQERKQIVAGMATMEAYLVQLHMLAGAARAMADEAYPALSVEPPRRSYEILAESDEPAPKAPRLLDNPAVADLLIKVGADL